MNAAAPIRSVAVLGGGLVAASAALAFARALPRAVTTLIVTPANPAALADRLPTVAPSAAAMLERIGLDQAALLAHRAATPRLAQRFEDWNRERVDWLLPDGEAAAVAGPGLLHQRWLEAARVGAPPPFHTLFPAAALAQAGRFTLNARGVLAGADHALRLDPGAASRALAAAAVGARVQTRRGSVAVVTPDQRGGIASIRLDGGDTVVAELFVDATGPAGLPTGDTAFEDWSGLLPVDRLLLQPDDAAEPSLIDSHRALDIGWSARWSRPDGGVRALGYASALTGEDRARRTLAAARDATELIALRPGRRSVGWSGNHLRLGEAAVQPGPLSLSGFTLALRQLELALDLMPGQDMEPLLIAEYNRRAGLAADRLRDFLAAFYVAGTRRRGVFWQTLNDRALPDTLRRTLQAFRRRGLVPHQDEDPIGVESWAALLLGQGVRSERRDALAMSAPADRIAASLETTRAALSAAAHRAPAYPRQDPRAGAAA